MRLSAPLPAVQTVLYLPNPEWQDRRAPKLDVTFRRSMNNTTRTYVKTSGNWTFEYDLNLPRNLALRLRTMVQSFYNRQWLLLDHDDRRWRVYLTNNPFQFTASRRAEPVREMNTIHLTFEGTEL